ncbi:MAG: hypothetical protein RLZZ81_144 [Pseudomonadota bacterium]|jgi:tetratricopeptide (TPR) repeat protein
MKGKITPLKIPENNHILWLPLETHSTILNTAIKKYSDIIKNFKLKDDYLRTIEEIEDSTLALEFANLVIKRVKKVQTQKKLLEYLLKNYSYEELKNHELFKDYEISEYNSLINKNSNVEIFFEYKPSSSRYLAKIINQFIAKENIFRLAVIEKNISLMEEIAKDLLKTAHVVLNLLEAQKQEEWYQKYLNFIKEIVLFVKPEFQPDIIKQLADIGDFSTLSSFSEILLSIKQYEKVITLLEPRLPNILNSDHKNKEIYFCRYNLSAAYNNTGKLSLAEEQLLRILKDRPNDSDSIYSLFNIYLLNGKATEAKNLIKNAPKDIKILTEMSFNLAEISEAKLNLINQDNLSKDSKEQFRCFQYIAKYNKYSASEKILNEENLKDELIEVSNSIGGSILLSTTALYTKQYELAKQFIQKIPKNKITSYLSNIFQEIEFLLNPEEYINQIHIEALVSNLTFSQAQAIEKINKIITCLIAIKKYDLALNKVEEILQYDNKNQEAIENGLAAARLANDQEKIQKYTDLLYLLEELVQYEDPKKTHEYYQSIKEAHLLNAVRQIIPNTHSNWKIKEEGEITSDSTPYLGKHKGLECYGKISRKLKLDNTQYTKFENALKKGIIYRQQGCNGVKFIGKKVVEIKIDGDQRLFANILHSNEHGELLINFDHQGNHNDVVKFAGEHHLEFHQDLL